MGLRIDGRNEAPDELSQLLQEPHRNNRHDIWLWLCQYQNPNLDLAPNTCNGTSMRDVIARSFIDNENNAKLINPLKDQFLVPPHYLNWISNDERQYHWLLPRIDEITGKSFPQGLVHLTGRSLLIAMLDIWNIDINEKAREIDHLRNFWIRHTARDSQLDWFTDKKDGAKRCICAWEWIQKNHLLSFSRQPPISNYKELLMFFDQAELGENEQKAIIQKIMRRWNRKQFDERAADKKQINVMLSITVIAQLDELAKKHGLRRAQVVETLVRMEVDTGMYLEES